MPVLNKQNNPDLSFYFRKSETFFFSRRKVLKVSKPEFIISRR
jgi:hypothetical protein